MILNFRNQFLLLLGIHCDRARLRIGLPPYSNRPRCRRCLALNLEGSSNIGNYKSAIIDHFRCSAGQRSLLMLLSGLEPQSTLNHSLRVLFDLIIFLLILSGVGSVQRMIVAKELQYSWLGIHSHRWWYS